MPKTLGDTNMINGGDMESHELNSARKQKRYWLKPLPGFSSVLDISFSELLDTKYVNDESQELDSSMMLMHRLFCCVMLMDIVNHHKLQA